MFLRFFALIPTFQPLRINDLVKNLESEYVEDYTLEKDAETADTINFRLLFTQHLIDKWKKRFESEVDSAYGIEVIAEYLTKVHYVKITSTGIFQIELEIDDFNKIEYVQDELSWHYYTFIEKSAEVLRKLRYFLPLHVQGELFPHSNIIALPISYGIDIGIDSLARATNLRLKKLVSDDCEVQSYKAGYILYSLSKLERLQTFLLQQDNYDKIAEMLSATIDIKNFLFIYKIAINRIQLDTDIKRSWEFLYHEAAKMSEFYEFITEHISHSLRLYTDNVGILSVFATILGIEVGIFFAGLTFPDQRLKIPIIEVSIISAFITMIVLWRGRGIFLFIKQLEKLQKYLSIGFNPT